MKQADFIREKDAAWRELDTALDAMERKESVPDLREIPAKFRQVCGDTALAEKRLYHLGLIERLNARMIRGIGQFQKATGQGWSGLVRFFQVEFPSAVRREWRLFWLCSAAFWLPFFLMSLAHSSSVPWIESFLGADGMDALDQMYGPEADLEAHREEFSSDFAMFAFYISNNVGINLRTFSAGVLAGAGAVFVLIFNGLNIGASSGYVHSAGVPEKFWSFVSGHSSWEILGMILAGVAGMKFGIAWIAPGRLSRAQALRAAAGTAVTLVLGAASMTLVAAAIEGFWAARPFPAPVKYAVGIGFWLVLTAYFLFAGRGNRGEA